MLSGQAFLALLVLQMQKGSLRASVEIDELDVSKAGPVGWPVGKGTSCHLTAWLWYLEPI